MSSSAPSSSNSEAQQFSVTTAPIALSNREEDELRKTVRAEALKACDPIVKEFADCATGRTVSVAWACRKQYKEVQNCMRSIQGEEAMIQRRKQFLQDKRDAKANAERI